MDRDFQGSSERCVTLHHTAIGRSKETVHVKGFLVAEKQVIDVDDIAQFLTFLSAQLTNITVHWTLESENNFAAIKTLYQAELINSVGITAERQRVANLSFVDKSMETDTHSSLIQGAGRYLKCGGYTPGVMDGRSSAATP